MTSPLSISVSCPADSDRQNVTGLFCSLSSLPDDVVNDDWTKAAEAESNITQSRSGDNERNPLVPAVTVILRQPVKHIETGQ